VCYSAFTAVGRTPEEIDDRREAARAQIAFYGSTPAYRPVLESHGLGELQPRLQDLTRGGQWDRLAAEVPDDILDLFAQSGSPEAVCANTAETWAGLVDHVVFPAELWTTDFPDRRWARAAETLREAQGRS
jgi:hypothetical protein